MTYSQFYINNTANNGIDFTFIAEITIIPASLGIGSTLAIVL